MNLGGQILGNRIIIYLLCKKQMPHIDLKLRTFTFAVDVAKMIETLPSTLINRQYNQQLIRCSSSVAANYRASQRAKSTADFINKLKIVEEEADETLVFLELLLPFNTGYETVIRHLIVEGTEILKIIEASINTARANSK
jgi:four helix bundle protein